MPPKADADRRQRLARWRRRAAQIGFAAPSLPCAMVGAFENSAMAVNGLERRLPAVMVFTGN